MGKGDSYRKVDQAKYGANYDAIFRKGKHASEVPALDLHCSFPDCECPLYSGFCKATENARDAAARRQNEQADTGNQDVLG